MTELLAEIARDLPGWSWTVYSKCGAHGPRAVLVNPDCRIQVGEDGATVEQALRNTIDRVKSTWSETGTLWTRRTV